MNRSPLKLVVMMVTFAGVKEAFLAYFLYSLLYGQQGTIPSQGSGVLIIESTKIAN